MTYQWHAIEPEFPCPRREDEQFGPEAHERLEVEEFGSDIPVAVFCPRCGAHWTVVVMPT